jgi:hypothetical protein
MWDLKTSLLIFSLYFEGWSPPRRRSLGSYAWWGRSCYVLMFPWKDFLTGQIRKIPKNMKRRMEERKRRDFFINYFWLRTGGSHTRVFSIGQERSRPTALRRTHSYGNLPYNQMKTTLLRWRLQFCPKILDAGELCCFVRIWDLKWDLETWRSLYAEPTNKKVRDTLKRGILRQKKNYEN